MTTSPFISALSRGLTVSWPELAARYLEEYLDKLHFALGQLPADRLWWRPTPESNSVANLVLHLCGNLSLWLLVGVGGASISRDRAAEFAARDGAGAAELAARLDAVVRRCTALLRGLRAEEVERAVSIQGYATDVRGAVFHAVEHMSYHTGQILLLLKQSLPAGERLELYPQHRGE